ncbi:MAG: hypothetical protein FJ387_23535 [Verrucomicrobia bacterium]|nr:hypothetical protein [Verrucomicrobiota bacterium]
MNCPSCQREVQTDWRVCPQCEAKLAGPGAGAEAEGAEAGAAGSSLAHSLEEEGSQPTPSVPPNAARSLGDRYEVLEEIGRGGFGVVYRGRDRKLNRVVAIKRLLSERVGGDQGAAVVQRFRRESQLIALLNHRNIVQVYDHDEDGEGWYIVMEYVGGGTLWQRLKREGKLGLEEALGLMRGICQGVAYAHRRNLVHRDLKPRNILLAEEGEAARVPKIVDFGLARGGDESEVSLSGHGLGTLGYMAPEQRRNAKGVNHTADIYSLGKILYELVTGENPENVDPEAIPPAGNLGRVILKCLKTRPEERYFSVEDLWRELEKLGGGDTGRIASGLPTGNTCPNCQALNVAEARFCEVCGSGLTRRCPECEQENSVSRRYCRACGTDVMGLAAVLEAVGRLEKLRGDRRWSRVLEEAEAAPKGLRLPGPKGGEAGRQVEQWLAEARAKLTEQEALARSLSEALEAEAYEQAGELAEKVLELDPQAEEVRALRQTLPGKIAERDARRALEVAAGFEAAGQLESGAEALAQFLARHGDGEGVRERLLEIQRRIEQRDCERALEGAAEAERHGRMGEGLEAIEAYLERHEDGAHRSAVLERLTRLSAVARDHQEFRAALGSADFASARAGLDRMIDRPCDERLAASLRREVEAASIGFAEHLKAIEQHRTAGETVAAEARAQSASIEFPRCEVLSALQARCRDEAAFAEAGRAAGGLAQAGKLAEGIQAWQGYLDSSPGAAHRDAAQRELGKLESAAAQADRLEQELAAGHLDRAEVSLRELERLGKEFAGAIERCQQAVEEKRTTFRSALAAARTHLDRHELRDAQAQVGKARGVWQGAEEARRLEGEIEALMAQRDRLRELAIEAETQGRVKRALACWREVAVLDRQEDCAGAIQRLEQALEVSRRQQRTLALQAAGMIAAAGLICGLIWLGFTRLRGQTGRTKAAALEAAAYTLAEWNAVEKAWRRAGDPERARQAAAAAEGVTTDIERLLAEAKARSSESGGKFARAALAELLRRDADHTEAKTLLRTLTSRYPPAYATRAEPWENSLSMRFVPVAGTDLLFSVWETRVHDFKHFARATGHDPGKWMWVLRADGWKARSGFDWQEPGFQQDAAHPVVGVSWDDATKFCAWLTATELAAGWLGPGQAYRLPTDAEWDRAVGTAKYPWGPMWPPPAGGGNYAGQEAAGVSDASWPADFRFLEGFEDHHARTAPVGSYWENDLGLCDLGGNVWEWCQDWYRKDMNSNELRTSQPELEDDSGGQQYRVLRGGSWSNYVPGYMLANARYFGTPAYRASSVGFRVVLANAR